MICTKNYKYNCQQWNNVIIPLICTIKELKTNKVIKPITSIITIFLLNFLIKVVSSRPQTLYYFHLGYLKFLWSRPLYSVH